MSAYCYTPNLISRTPVFDDLKSRISEAAIHGRLASYPPPLYPKARDNALNIISHWINDLGTRQRIMWIIGPTGKFAIAQTIAEQYKDSRLAASYFFLRNSPDCGVANHLFTTLAWQFGASIPETYPYIEHELIKDPLLPTKSIEIQFDHLVVKVFENLFRDNPGLGLMKFLVIIDGVDECATEYEQRRFLTLIGELARTNIPLRFLICSGPEAHIKETFNVEIVQNITRAIVLDEKLAPSDDIWRYLEKELFRIFSAHNIRPPLPPCTDIDHLVSKASGQDIYAHTVIRFIDDNDCNPKEQLDIILNLRSVNSSSPYAQLDQLYIQILSQQPDIKFLSDIFVLVIAIPQPQIKFICRRLRISKEELRRKVRKMHPLLQISDLRITTYHPSLSDFFQDKERAGKYHIDPVRVAMVRFQERSRPFARGLRIPVIIILAIPLAIPILMVACLVPE